MTNDLKYEPDIDMHAYKAEQILIKERFPNLQFTIESYGSEGINEPITNSSILYVTHEKKCYCWTMNDKNNYKTIQIMVIRTSPISYADVIDELRTNPYYRTWYDKYCCAHHFLEDIVIDKNDPKQGSLHFGS